MIAFAMQVLFSEVKISLQVGLCILMVELLFEQSDGRSKVWVLHFGVIVSCLFEDSA